MFKNAILKKILFIIVLIFGAMFVVNYLDIAPEAKKEIKVLPNDIVTKVK
jgi:hypothetical protein